MLIKIKRDLNQQAHLLVHLWIFSGYSVKVPFFAVHAAVFQMLNHHRETYLTSSGMTKIRFLVCSVLAPEHPLCHVPDPICGPAAENRGLVSGVNPAVVTTGDPRHQSRVRLNTRGCLLSALLSEGKSQSALWKHLRAANETTLKLNIFYFTNHFLDPQKTEEF